MICCSSIICTFLYLCECSSYFDENYIDDFVVFGVQSAKSYEFTLNKLMFDSMTAC